MAKLTPQQVYQLLTAAGFDPAAATTMTAIAGGESGWDTTSTGDLGLTNPSWGPSYGLFQVRTLKGDTGRGTDRDITWLSGSPANQAKAAYDISRGGRDFTPWTVYTTGKYRDFLGQAQGVSGVTGGAAGISGTPTFSQTGWGPDWLPWNWGTSILGDVRTLVVETGFGILGLALLGYGLARVVKGRHEREGT